MHYSTTKDVRQSLTKGIEMDIKDLLEKAEERTEGRKGLAKLLGISANALTDAKAHRRPLPDYACIRLARFVGLPEIEVMAASALATETHQDRRDLWRPFAERLARHATLASLALVANFVTPPDANAHQADMAKASSWYYVNSSRPTFSVPLKHLPPLRCTTRIPSRFQIPPRASVEVKLCEL